LKKEYSDFWDKKTKRPSWAGNIVIYYENYQISRVMNDSQSDPKKLQALKDQMESIGLKEPGRPVIVQGIVVPCKTAGRGTAPNALGIDLEYRPEDRGHIMAASLGGPEEILNIVPMPRVLNQKFSTIGFQLCWRQMEVLVAYNADLILRGNTADVTWIPDKMYRGKSPTAERSSARKKKPRARQADPGYHPYPRVDNYKKIFFVNDQPFYYPLLEIISTEYPSPREFLRYTAVLKYRNGIGNSPTTVKITAELGNGNQWAELYKQEFQMAFQEGDYQQIERVEAHHREKLTINRKSAAYKEEKKNVVDGLT
jgi:hypothetical protein